MTQSNDIRRTPLLREVKPHLPHNPRSHAVCGTCSPDKPLMSFRVLHGDIEPINRGKHRGIPGFDWDHEGYSMANGIIRNCQTGKIVAAEETGFELIDWQKDVVHNLNTTSNAVFSIRKDAGKHRTAEDMRNAILDGKMVYNLGQPVFSEQMHPEDRFISDGEIYARASNQEGKEDVISAFAQALLDEPDLLNNPAKDEVTGSVVQAQDAIAKLAKKNPAFKLKRKKK